MWVNLGNAQRDTGKLADALLSYQRGLLINPESTLLLGNMEQLEEMSGKPKQHRRVRVDALDGQSSTGYCDDGTDDCL